MTEREPGEAGIDNLLRRSMAEPIPSLPPDLEQRLMRELRRSSQPRDRGRRVLFAGYGLTSAVASTMVMHGQGLDWRAIAATIFVSAALVAITFWGWRARSRATLAGRVEIGTHDYR